MPIYDEIWNMKGRTATPGGSAMNTARAANYFLKNRNEHGRVTYFGSVGKDPRADIIKKDLNDAGIYGNFHIDAETPTGTCAVLVKDKDRTLCANLAAACKYSPQHLTDNFSQLDRAKIIYTTSFFITSSNESL